LDALAGIRTSELIPHVRETGPAGGSSLSLLALSLCRTHFLSRPSCSRPEMPKKEVEKVPDKLTDAEKKKKKQENKAKAAGTSIAQLTAGNEAKKSGKK